jgi:hypothetical protein
VKKYYQCVKIKQKYIDVAAGKALDLGRPIKTGRGR